jgi:hypothetical protein
MLDELKIFGCWLLVFAGAAVVIMAPWNLKGALMCVGGGILLAVGLVPILQKRKQDRLAKLANEDAQQ